MSVTRATTIKEIVDRTCDAIARRAARDDAALANGDGFTFDVTLPDVAHVTVTTEVAYQAPRLVGRPLAVWVARRLGVRAVAPRLTGDRAEGAGR